jgi:Organic solute transporter Ostalpha
MSQLLLSCVSLCTHQLYLFCTADRVSTCRRMQSAHVRLSFTAHAAAANAATIACCVLQMVLHLTNFVDPRQQSQIVRIIFMVPVYSVTAYLSLLHPQWALSITTVR